MSKVHLLFAFFAFLTFCPACTFCGGSESSRTPDDTEVITRVEEQPENDGAEYKPENTDDPSSYHDENGSLIGPTSGEDRTCVYCSGVNPGDPELTKSDMPEELTDEIFGENKLVYVYYGPGEIPDTTTLIIEFAEPKSSRYIGKIRGDEVQVYGVHSDGSKSLLSDYTLGPGRESVINETHLLTYIIEVKGSIFDTPAMLIELDMLYDIEDYGTGNMQTELWIEP